MASPEQLWTSFNNRKLAAERARKDFNGRDLTTITSANDSTIEIKMADSGTGTSVGTFTTNQASGSTLTIPAANGTAGSETPGIMSAADKAKLDGIEQGATATTITDSQTNGNIVVNGSEIDVYTHPSPGQDAQHPGSDPTQTTAGVYKVTIDRQGHATSSAQATASDVGITVTSTSVSDGQNTFNQYVHPSPASDPSQSTAALYKVTVDSDGHVLTTAQASASDLNITVTSTSVSDGTNTFNQYTHPTDGANTTAGDSAAQTPGFGGTFKALYAEVDNLGHTTTLTEHNVTIPNTVATTSAPGLMSAADKTTVDLAADVIPNDADANNQLVTEDALAEALADFGGFEVVGLNGSGKPDVASPSDKVIYLTKDEQSTATDPYTEWIYTGDPEQTLDPSKWEIIGETSIDLTNYVQYPQSHSANNIVTFGSGNTIQDSGATVASLTNAIESISVNGAAQTIDSNKNVDITVPVAATTAPVMDGTAAVGTSTAYAREDHVHPSDTSKQDVLVFNTAYDATTNKAATMSDVTSSVAHKADLVSNATADNFASLDASGNLQDSGYSASDFKTVQTAVTDPTASGNATSFIDTISQDTNGEITVTKKTVPTVVASTNRSGGTDGLMTAVQAETLNDLNTWKYDTFTDGSGPTGTETAVVFPEVQSGN